MTRSDQDSEQGGTILRNGPVHICLVSDQALANINPALAPEPNRDYFPARRVILICDQEHLEQARYQKQVLLDHDIPTDIHAVVQGFDPLDISALVGQVSAVFDTLSPAEKLAVVLNASGGSKALSLAAVSVFMRNNLPVFLVDARNDRLVWLSGEEKEAFDIPDRADLEDVFASNGFQIIGPAPVRHSLQPKLLRLGQRMAKNVAAFAKVIGPFNGYMSRAKDEGGIYRAGPVAHKLRENADFHRMVECFCDTGLVSWKGQHLVFRGIEAARFLRGGWFELYAYAVIDQLRRDWAKSNYPVQIGDLASGVNIEAPTGSRNEIDVAFLCNNRLYLIECKTGYFDADAHPTGPASTMLYKLDWLGDIGAPVSKTAIFSYRPIPEHDRSRARQMNIDVIAGGQEILRLREFLEQWIEVPAEAG
ncbi:Card1-like endonuclease domain-containing protein [Kiloniella laminariae]|uniref:Card1-like endonuclease domain-containing protein n=1 Tax=Kiloniella laminariae TaxID=454162 RepID=UPI00036BDD00|nr:DUF1887 family CARF protein [Kiloniella laminariae]